MTRHELRKVVREFRKGILDGREPDGMCFAVCSPLQGYLATCGISTDLVRGTFREYEADHWWLELEDGTVVDPTVSQFSDEFFRMPTVYIGPKKGLYLQHSPPLGNRQPVPSNTQRVCNRWRRDSRRDRYLDNVLPSPSTQED
jgi:hypothetical protein